MANSNKNIVITPNTNSSTDDPKIVFSGADSTTTNMDISIKAYPANNGTLSFEGSAGQLFSISNTLNGTLYSVNDISGIPSIEVLDTGLIKMAQYSGNLVLGTSTNVTGYKLQVNGNILLGNKTGSATATPLELSLGATYSTVAGANLKLKTYDDGINYSGLGNSAGQVDYVVTGTNSHVFYTNGLKRAKIAGDGTFSVGTADPFTVSTTGRVVATSYGLAPGQGEGYGFWSASPNIYGMMMAASTDPSYGGRMAGEINSDYNIYFTIANNINRGFVFQNSYGSKLMSINPDAVRTSVPIAATGNISATGNMYCGELIATGNLYVGNTTPTSSYIFMGDSDEGQRMIHCNSNRIGFLDGGAGNWGAWCADDGSWNATSMYANGFYGNLYTAGGAIQSTLAGTGYNTCTQVREVYGYGSNSAAVGAPRLGFHWSGIVASSISMETDGHFYFNNNTGTGRESIHAAAGYFTTNVNANNAVVTPTIANGGGEIKISGLGSATNTAVFEADGHLRLDGTATVWKDLDFPMIVRNTGANIPVQTAFLGNLTMPLWQVNDYVQADGQELPHDWKQASIMQWHIHIVTNTLDIDNRYIKFEIEYTWANRNAAFITPVVIQSSELLIPANTPAKTHLIFDISGPWAPTLGTIAAHVKARLKRITATGLAPTSHPFCDMMQLHYEADSIGSRQITTK